MFEPELEVELELVDPEVEVELEPEPEVVDPELEVDLDVDVEEAGAGGVLSGVSAGVVVVLVLREDGLEEEVVVVDILASWHR